MFIVVFVVMFIVKSFFPIIINCEAIFKCYQSCGKYKIAKIIYLLIIKEKKLYIEMKKFKDMFCDAWIELNNRFIWKLLVNAFYFWDS